MDCTLEEELEGGMLTASLQPVAEELLRGTPST